VVEIIELPQQDDAHQEQSRKCSNLEESSRFRSIFIGALELDINRRVQVGRGEPVLDLGNLGRAFALNNSIRPNEDQSFAIAAFDLGDLLGRHAGDELRQWNLTAWCRNAQPIQRLNAALAFRKTDANVDLVQRIVGAIAADQNAVGHELHSGANLADINPELAGLGAVDFQLILDAGQGTAVFNLAKAFHTIDKSANLTCDFHERGTIIRANGDLNVLADRWALFELLHFGANTWHVDKGGSDILLGDAAIIARFAVHQVDQDSANRVLRRRPDAIEVERPGPFAARG